MFDLTSIIVTIGICLIVISLVINLILLFMNR